MATLPPRHPTSAFPTSRRRRSILEKCPSLTSLKGCSYNGDDFWIPRGPPVPTVSIPYLREAINSLDSKMASLMSQRHELESHLERAVRSQSPVLRIPSEILSTIFVIGVLGLGEEDSVMISTLMLVSRYWAEVALSTPALWAKITVGPHDSLQKARRRLERSQNHPLDVSISFGNRMEYGTNVTDQICGAMDLLRPAFGRVRSFQLDVPNRPTAHAALLRCQEDAPILETLSIRVNHALQDDLYSRPTLPLFNGHTPRLQSCSLVSFNFGWDPKLMRGLRVLSLDGYFNSFTPSAKALLGFLRECPDLEELSLRNFSGGDANKCDSHGDDAGASLPKIHLRSLRKIRFYYSGIVLTRQIMEQITFPSLASLEMCFLENVTPIINQLYDQAVSRLPLKHLRIETCLFNEMKFLNLLRRLGSLVTLQLVDIEDISSYTLKTLSSSQPWVCPKLDALCIDGCTSLEWDHIRTFVESRLPANPSKFHTSPISLMSTASAAAAAFAKSQQNQQRTNYPAALGPQRLRGIDVTRCPQISKDMIQWLRMYVADVRCETAKGSWGESSLSDS